MLNTNFKDDVLNADSNTKRKYRMIDNGDGTVSFEDVTDYTTVGSGFGAGAVNNICKAINGKVKKNGVNVDSIDFKLNGNTLTITTNEE